MSRTTIRVFEYTRLRVGDRLRTVEGGSASFTTAHFDALSRFSEYSEKDFIRLGHRSVRFTNYVGYVQVGTLGIEVLPKADRNSNDHTTPWRDALLDMLRVARGLKLMHPTKAHLELRRATLFDVYVAQFLVQVETLLRQGLVRGYRKVQENRTAFRGRLLVAQNVRANVAAQQRVFVEHEIYDHDTVVNQTLRSALDALRDLPLPSSLRSKVTRVRAGFPEVVSPLPSLAALDRHTLTRNTQRYRDALSMARMILEHRAPSLRGGGSELLALLFDMNVLWERYVAVLLGRIVPAHLRITTQSTRTFWRSGEVSKIVRPDIIVHSPEDDAPRVVLDTKWKVPKRGKPSDADLKQMFVYNERYRCARSLLVYPAARGHTNTDGVFDTKDHTCGLRFVGLFDAEGRYSRQTATNNLLALIDTDA